MQFSSTVTLEGLEEALTATLSAASAAAVNLAREELRERLRARFASEGQLYGPAWQPRQQPRSWPLLQKSGRLRESFLDPNSPEHVEIPDEDSEGQPQSILFGSAVPYAAYHQFGTRRLPARPILTAQILQGVEIPNP